MSWAGRRRALILFIVGAVGVAFLVILSIATLYQAPSCSDNKQNQGEAGIDCGGPCAYFCTAQEQPPTVLFTKAINNGASRTDVIAMIDNKNPLAAAKNVPYKIALYGSDQKLLAQAGGNVDLPPGTSVPVFVAGVYGGSQSVANAFLTIDLSGIKWFSFSNASRVVPVVSGTRQTGTSVNPRIEATLTNGSTFPLSNILLVAFVHNSTNDIIAASQTIVPFIGPQSSAPATFTWNAPFSAVPALIEVIPVVPFPSN